MASSSCPQACNVPPARPNASSTAEDYGKFKEQGIQVFKVTKDQGIQAGCRSEIQQLKDSFQIPEKLPKVVIGTDFGGGTVPSVVVCDKTGCQWKHNASTNLSPCKLQAHINQRSRALNCLQYKLNRIHMKIRATRDDNAKLKQQIEDLINEQSSCPNTCDKSQEKPRKPLCPPNSAQGCSGPCEVQKSNQSCSGPCSGGEESDSGTNVKNKNNYCPAWQRVQQKKSVSVCKIMTLIAGLDKLLRDEDDNHVICHGPCNVLKQKQPCSGPCTQKTPKSKSSFDLEMSPQQNEELISILETCLATCNTYRKEFTCPFPCNQRMLADDRQQCSIKQENKPCEMEHAILFNIQELGETLAQLLRTVSTGSEKIMDKISSLLQEWPTKLNKTRTLITNCVLPTEKNRPTDNFQSSGKVKRITQPSTTEGPCPLSCAIDELESQLISLQKELGKTQEVNEDLETQQDLLSSLPCPAYLPCQPCEPALPKCPPVSSPYICGSSSKTALRPCASRPPLPPCRPPKPSTASEGSNRCRK